LSSRAAAVAERASQGFASSLSYHTSAVPRTEPETSPFVEASGIYALLSQLFNIAVLMEAQRSGPSLVLVCWTRPFSIYTFYVFFHDDNKYTRTCSTTQL
jgi:hypothetical protein